MINIKSDSRKINKGDTFIALKGFNSNGEDYVDVAIRNGASKIIVESDNKYSVETIKVADTRKYLTNYLSENYKYILDNMNLIGLTGTNGKTTTCFLIYQILNNLNIKCAYIGTIGFYLDKKICNLPNTSPDICDLYDLIIRAHDEGYDNVVMEVSSQGLDMGRFEGIKFNYALFTNLTQDHLDYHGNMENYAKAKRILFDSLKSNGVSILNIDDEYKDIFKTKRTVYYGLANCDYQIKNIKLGYNTNFDLIINDKTYCINTKLIGEYNIYNLASAISVLCEMGLDINDIIPCLKTISSPPGRMDIINYKDNLIIVDYAHTPDAMKNIYDTVNKIKLGKIYTVFGCTGDRDRTKRPVMMELALTNSEFSIITSDDLHDEEFSHIVADMENGIKLSNYKVIKDRGLAIKECISLLNNKDILLVLGKGHEDVIIVKDKRIPFNDKEFINSLIKEKVSAH